MGEGQRCSLSVSSPARLIPHVSCLPHLEGSPPPDLTLHTILTQPSTLSHWKIQKMTNVHLLLPGQEG